MKDWLKMESEAEAGMKRRQKGNSREGRLGTRMKISTNCKLCAILLKFLRLREVENAQ